jgi:hypothetical protein
MHINIISQCMSLCCAQGQIYLFTCNLFPISLFIKCRVVSCVQIMECSNVLVTQRKKTEFFTDGLVQDLNHLLLFIDGQQHNSLTMPEMNHVTTCSSLAALIKYREVRYCVEGIMVWWQCGVMAVWCDGSVTIMSLHTTNIYRSKLDSMNDWLYKNFNTDIHNLRKTNAIWKCKQQNTTPKYILQICLIHFKCKFW